MKSCKSWKFYLAFFLVTLGACRTPLETLDRRSNVELAQRSSPGSDIISLFVTVSEQSSLIISTIDEFLSASRVESSPPSTQFVLEPRRSGVRNPLDYLRQIASEVGVARETTWQGRPLWRWQSLSAKRLLGSDLYIFCQPSEGKQSCSIDNEQIWRGKALALAESSLLNLGSLSIDLKQLSTIYHTQSLNRLQWPKFNLEGSLVMTQDNDVITIKSNDLVWQSKSLNLRAEAFSLDISQQTRSILGFKLAGKFLKSQSESKWAKISIETKKGEKQGRELTFDLE